MQTANPCVAAKLYREHFQASAVSRKPDLVVALQVIAAETDAAGAVVHDTTAALPATDPKPASSAFLDRLAPAASPLRSRGLCELLFPSFLVSVEVHFASTDGRSVVFTSSRIPCPPGRLAYKRSWRSHPASDRRDESHIPDRRSPCTLSR